MESDSEERGTHRTARIAAYRPAGLDQAALDRQLSHRINELVARELGYGYRRQVVS